MVYEVDGMTETRPAEERFRAALERIRAEHGRQKWHPDTKWPSESARGWHNGYITCAAKFSLEAFEALDPEGWAEHEEDIDGISYASDADYWRHTGHCGHCGIVASSCQCQPRECGCWTLHGAPLEPYRTWGELMAENEKLRSRLHAYENPPLFAATPSSGGLV